MAEITVGPEDWQQVAVTYAQENIDLRARLAAAVRTLGEMEKANESAREGQGQEDGQPEHQGDAEGRSPSKRISCSSSQDGRHPAKAKARK